MEPEKIKTILEISQEERFYSWENLFSSAYYELETISNYVEREEKKGGYISFPLRKDIFAAFRLCFLNNLKVVILGQDPYHTTTNINDNIVPTAVGLSFSGHPEDVIPPSLKNIYKELENTVPDFVAPRHPDLRPWALQGVLLLNTVLTVKPHEPGSHHPGVWEPFIKRVLTEISLVKPKCIYLLWGAKAKKLRPLIGNKSIIFESGHPSPFSCKQFFGCNHFQLCNKELIAMNLEPIDWRLDQYHNDVDNNVDLE